MRNRGISQTPIDGKHVEKRDTYGFPRFHPSLTALRVSAKTTSRLTEPDGTLRWAGSVGRTGKLREAVSGKYRLETIFWNI